MSTTTMDDGAARGTFTRTRGASETQSRPPDVTLEVDGVEFEAVRSTLAAKSPYFAAMFSGNFKEDSERKIAIKGVRPASMKVILDSTRDDGASYVEDVDLVPTLQAACMLQFEDVRERCVSAIVETLSCDTCLAAYFAAVRLDIPTLARKALCVALVEFKDVVCTRAFFDLGVDRVHSYLSHRALHVDSEIDVFEAAMKWWYEHERDTGGCAHERRDGADADDSDGCTETLLALLRCVDYGRLGVADMNLLPTYPGIGEHAVVRDVIERIVSIGAGGGRAARAGGDDDGDRVADLAGALLGCEPRMIPRVPCVIGTTYAACDGRDDVGRRRGAERSFVLYYDARSDELRPLIELKHVGGDGPNLEGYRVEVWKNRVLLLGGEFTYGFGNWSRSCWSYDTLKTKWSRFTTLPSVRRHFKTCVVRDVLYAIGGTGQYRVVQNNMDRYDLRAGRWRGSVRFPYDLHDVECCEHGGTLFVTCGGGGGGTVETLSFDPDTERWTRLQITDPYRLYRSVGTAGHAVLSTSSTSKNYKRYVPFVVGDDLYINGKYLLGLRRNSLDLEVFYFGPGAETYDDGYESVGACVVDGVLNSFCVDETSADAAAGATRGVSVRRFDVATKTPTARTDARNGNVRIKRSAGCFASFDYESLSFDDTIRAIDGAR